MLHHLKKNSSLYDKHLVIIDSNARDDTTESTSSFNYTFSEPIKRVTKIDLVAAKVPKSFNNVNNDNTTMSITTQTFTESATESLVLNDEEIQNNVIQSTNLVEGTVYKRNSAGGTGDVRIYSLFNQGTFMYQAGTYTGLLDLQDFTDSTTSTILSNNGGQDIFVAQYTLEHLLNWRFKIAGLINEIDPQVVASETDVYVTGLYNSFPLQFYNADDTTNINNNIVSNNVYTTFLAKYSNSGTFAWGFKITGTTDTAYPSLIAYDDINDTIYIAGTYTEDLVFVNKDGTNDTTVSHSGAANNAFVAKYNSDGNLQWKSYMRSSCSITSMSINPVNQNIVLGLTYLDTLSFYDSSNTTSIVNDLPLEGTADIAIVEYDVDGVFVNRLRIGGSSSETNVKIQMGVGIMYVTGTFTSNPTKLGNTDDTVSNTLPTTTNIFSEIFVALYVVDNVLMTKTNTWGIHLKSQGTLNVSGVDISSDSSANIVGTYNNLVKFNDINGPVIGKDLANSTGTNNTFIAKYTFLGNLEFRSTITGNSAVEGTSIDAKSKNIYISGYFSSNAEFVNSDDSTNSTLTNLGTTNGFMSSYVNNVNNFTIDNNTLGKRVICRNLVSNDLNYTLNLNAFSQSMGFKTSQKYRAILFGSAISWTELEITSLNKTLDIRFNVGNTDTETFVTYDKTFDIEILATYTPFSLAFELSKLISNRLTVDPSLPFTYSQTFDPIVYDSDKNIFYMQFNINGTFRLQPTDLTNSTNLYLPDTQISQHCVIADVDTDITGDLAINDNSKITIRLKDDVTERRFNNADFSDAFPSVANGSGNMVFSAVLGSNLTATVGSTNDAVSDDIQINENIQFYSPWVVRKLDFSPNLQWEDIACSSDGSIVAALGDGTEIWLSTNGGITWTSKSASRTYVGVAMSSTGQYITATVNDGFIYVSSDFGITWIPKDSQRNWGAIAMSDDGQYQTAGDYDGLNDGFLYRSDDFGQSWTPTNQVGSWFSVAMSADGSRQVSNGFSESVWLSVDFGLTWAIIEGSKSWWDIGMSSTGQYITAVQTFGPNRVSSDFGATFTSVSPGYSQTASITMSDDGQTQFTAPGNTVFGSLSTDFGASNSTVNYNSFQRVIGSASNFDASIIYLADNGNFGAGGEIYKSTDTAATFNTVPALHTWTSLATSTDGRIIVATANNDYIYVSTDLQPTWTIRDSQRAWTSIAMTAGGLIQQATVNAGQVYESLDTGTTWSPITTLPTLFWQSSAMSADSTVRAVVATGQPIWYKAGAVLAWIASSSPSLNWTDIAMTADGTYQTAVADGSDPRISTNKGASWFSPITSSTLSYTAVTMSADGFIQYACSNGDEIQKSADRGDTWVATTSPILNWLNVQTNSDGTVVIAGADTSQIYLSTDSGTTWVQSLDPGTPFITTAAGLGLSSSGSVQYSFIADHSMNKSVDSGATYERVDLTPFASGTLTFEDVALSTDGNVQLTCLNGDFMRVSTDRGKTFTSVGPFSGSFYRCAVSGDGIIQLTTSFGSSGSVYMSTDTGTTWAVTTAPTGDSYRDLALSSTGAIQMGATLGGLIYVSTNTGATWADIGAGTDYWFSCDMSNNGTVMAAAAGTSSGGSGRISVSTNSGATWTQYGPTLSWTSIAVSGNDGSIMLASAFAESVYLSTDTGVTWVAISSLLQTRWEKVDISDDGTSMIIVYYNGFAADGPGGNVFVSSDTGVTWTIRESFREWSSTAISGDGGTQVAVMDDGLYYSHNFAVNEEITLNVKSISADPNIQDTVIFQEITDSILENLNGFNLAEATEFDLQRVTEASLEDLFIPPGNYNSATLVSTINALIVAENPTFTNAFTYNSITNKISFQSIFSGQDVISLTNLLTQMGLSELPAVITAGAEVIAKNVVNPDFSGPSLLSIKSNIIGELRQNITSVSTNPKLKNVISPIGFTNDDFVSIPIRDTLEIYLSKKETISTIDIQIVDEKGDIVNLNGGRVQLIMYFILA